MHSFLGLLTLLAIVACGYFLIRLIICFAKNGDKKFYGKRLAIALAVFLAGIIGFNSTLSPEQKAAYTAQRQAQAKEKQQKIAEKESAKADKKAKEETDKKAIEEQKDSAENAQVEAEAQTDTPENRIEGKIKEYVSKYPETTIDSITLNPDLGTEKEDDYVALVRLTWNRQNSGKRAKKMLDMFSSDMASKIYQDLPEVQEVAIFWTVPYLHGSAKISFERDDGGMRYTDEMFDLNFNK